MSHQGSEGLTPQGKVVVEIDVRHLGALLDPGAAYRLRNAILEVLDPQLGKKLRTVHLFFGWLLQAVNNQR
jgi:hypothetical protein